MESIPSVPVPTRAHCDAFAAAAEALARRRVPDIPQKDIQDFIALRWMAWEQGALRLTPLGQMALIRIQGRVAHPA